MEINHSTQKMIFQLIVPVMGKLIPPNQRTIINKKVFTFHAWHVLVKCPYCNHWHIHGWDPEEPEAER